MEEANDAVVQEHDHEQAAPAPHDAHLPESDDPPHAEHDHDHDHQHDVHEDNEHVHDADLEPIPPHEHHEHPNDQHHHHHHHHHDNAQVHNADHDPALDPAAVTAPPPTAPPPDAPAKPTSLASPPVAKPVPARSASTSRPASATAPRRRSSERYHASTEQLRLLVQAFQQDPTPSAATLSYLSTSIGMPMHNMVLWFKNRRARHKKSHPGETPVKGGRRSYVKSGIYARSPKKAKAAAAAAAASAVVNPPSAEAQADADASAAAAAAAAAATAAAGVAVAQTEQESQQAAILSTAVEAPAPVSDAPAAPAAPVGTAAPVESEEKAEALEAGVGAKRRLEEGVGEDGTFPAAGGKRVRYQGVREIVGDENACHSWDAQECHHRCCAFFVKSTVGCQQPEQTRVAMAVSEEFFLGEQQNGLTLTSAMQSLETSADVLDAIMDRVPEDGQGGRLSSGSRAVLREFIAQVRSGQAVHIQIDGHPEDEPEEGEHPNGAAAGAAPASAAAE